MILGLLILSIMFGGACGITAFCTGFGLIQSLAIYAIAGQLPFVVVPLLILVFGYLSDIFPASLERSIHNELVE